MQITPQASGVYVIAPTPFESGGAVDTASIDRLAAFYAENGVAGTTVLGQLGEAPKLEHAEALQVATRFIQRSKTPTIVGVSAPGFAAMRALARDAMDA